jgi:hypothetical protein
VQSWSGGIIFFFFFLAIFFPFQDPKNAVPIVERIFWKKMPSEKNKNQFKQVIKI